MIWYIKFYFDTTRPNTYQFFRTYQKHKVTSVTLRSDTLRRVPNIICQHFESLQTSHMSHILLVFWRDGHSTPSSRPKPVESHAIPHEPVESHAIPHAPDLRPPLRFDASRRRTPFRPRTGGEVATVSPSFGTRRCPPRRQLCCFPPHRGGCADVVVPSTTAPPVATTIAVMISPASWGDVFCRWRLKGGPYNLIIIIDL